jgi:exopolysaccharide production protein ExoZ
MKKIASLQGLRALAASSVVFYHAVDHISRTTTAEQSALVAHLEWVLIGNAGVDLFFCLSGFVMVYIHWADFQQRHASTAFLRKRLGRIAPIYWLLTSLAVGVLWIFPQASYHGRTLDWAWVAASYLFVPWVSNSGVAAPVLGLGWTLNYEMFFYLCFAVLLLLPRRLFLPILTAQFVLSVAIGLALQPQHPFPRMLTSPLLLEFLAGCFLGALMRDGRKIPTHVAILLICCAISVLVLYPFLLRGAFMPPLLRVVVWGAPAACLLAAASLSPIARDAAWPGWLVFVGDASYSIYLTHLFTLPAVSKASSATGFPIDPTALCFILFIASIAAGCLFYRLVEKPILDWQSASRGVRAGLAEKPFAGSV